MQYNYKLKASGFPTTLAFASYAYKFFYNSDNKV